MPFNALHLSHSTRTRRRFGLLVAAVSLTTLTTVSAAGASELNIVEFPTLSPYPTAITADHDGSIWYTTGWPTVRVGHVLALGHVTEFPIPIPAGELYKLSSVVVGPDDNLWLAVLVNNNASPPLSRIARMSRDGSNFVQFPVPASVHRFGVYPHAPTFLRVGPDGNIWFALSDAIGRITMNGDITLFYLPPDYCPGIGQVQYGLPSGIVFGPDGALWIASPSANAILRFDPVLEQFQVIPIGPCNFQVNSLNGVTVGPDGNLWFIGNVAEMSNNVTNLVQQLYRVTLSGEISAFSLGKLVDGFFASDIVSVNGSLFVAESGISEIVQVDPATGAIVQHFPTPTPGSGLTFMAVDFSGNIWFTEGSARQIGRLGGSFPCIDALSLTYDTAGLHLRFVLGTATNAFWTTWIAFDHVLFPLSAQVIPTLSPPVTFTSTIPSFPMVGNVGVFTLLVTAGGQACGDLVVIDTGG